jgi:hypothetical protein
MVAQRRAIGSPVIALAIAVVIMLAAIGTYVALSRPDQGKATTSDTSQSSPFVTRVSLQLACAGCYQGGTLPSLPPTILSLDGKSVNDSIELNGTALSSGSHHTISALPTYVGACPPNQAPCGYLGIKNITVFFQHWSACIYYPIPSNSTESCAVISVPNSQVDSISITVPAPGARGGMLVVYTAIYSLQSNSSSSTTNSSATLTSSTTETCLNC